MIDTIKALLRGIGRAGSYLVPYRSGGRLSTLGDYLYTAWLARHFKHIGANVYIRRPVSLRGGKYISIGSHSVIQKGCILNAWDRYGDQSFTPEIAIGEHVSIGEWSHLSAIRAIRIGNYVRTGRRVTIVDNSHGRGTSEELGMHPEDQPLSSKGVVTIGNNVRIADKVTILSGVTIGDNSTIGANAVVTHDIPAGVIAAGVPARVIRQISQSQNSSEKQGSLDS